tara:strand:- start:73 stop:1143 length:1071 start_codon:yes stop_codon:yes gene_type:complete
MKNEISFLILFLILFTSCNLKKEKIEFKNQGKLSKKTQKVISSIIEYGEITGPFVGELPTKPKQWDNFIELKKNATESELLTLMKHPNPVVKCYTYDILVNQKNENSFEILKINLKDSATVYTQYGCIGDETRVNDYLINSLFYKYSLRNDSLKKQKKELDSLIIFSNNLTLNYKNELLEKIKPEEKFYSQLRKLALSGENSAVITLSKFKKKENLPLIIAHLNSEITEIQTCGLKAVINYPDEALFNEVRKVHQQELDKKTGFDYIIIKILYEAIVSFKNLESRKLLEKTIMKTKDFQRDVHFENIWKALKNNPDKIYNGIIDKLNFSDYKLYNLEYEWNQKQSWKKNTARNISI